MDLLNIFAAWIILIATMLFLEALGLDFGFRIWPFGEFRNWLEFLQNGPGSSAAKLFWAVDHRNALSPWWYIAARPLINLFPSAPLILHLLVGLFIGIVAYLLLVELTRSRPFALMVGILSALFLPNVYRDEVIWNFVGALGCSLLSTWLFALFCKDRRRYGYLSASYLAWFVALSTYTIQIGAIGAVFFVSLRSRISVLPLPRAISRAAADVLPFAALLILYLMIWITTSPVGVPTAFQLEFTFDALARSIVFGIWNEHYYFFWVWVVASGVELMVVVFACTSLTMLAVLYRLRRGDYVKPPLKALAFAFLIGICLAIPTITLESMSNLWTPGTRWPMLMQFWSPFVFCIVVFVVLSAAPERYWLPLWKTATACSAAFTILLVLGFNRTQVVHARQELVFFNELQSIVTSERLSGAKFPRRYQIQLAEPAPFLPVVQLADPYAHTILGRDVSFRTVNTLPSPSEGNTLLIWKDQHLTKLLTTAPSGAILSPANGN